MTRCKYFKVVTFLLAIVMMINVFPSITLAVYKANDVLQTSVTNVYIPDGIYYIQNKKLSNYLQIDDGDAPLYSTNDAIMELWEYDGNEYQQWSIENVEGKYYKIISIMSGKALTVPTNALNQPGAKLVQQPYNDQERQQWYFEVSSSGSYIIRPRSGERYTTDWCMGANEGVLTSNGRNALHRAYNADSDYLDEWELVKLKEQAIVIIPEITGNSLQNESGNKVWYYLGRQNQIACDENGDSINSIYSYNPDNYGVSNNYKTIYETLSQEYSDSYDVIFFSYDWRMSCAEAALALEQRLSFYENCIIVAHGAGGLVASSYLDKSAANRGKVDKLITVGTPYTGAPKVLQAMESGQLFDNDSILSNYTSNFPVMYEFLPNAQYFDSFSSYITNNGTPLTTYNTSWNFIKALDWAKKSNNIVKPMFTTAQNFHNSLINNGVHITDAADVDTYKIVGTGETTIFGVNYNANGEIEDLRIFDGDGVVPIDSALNNVEKNSYKTYAFFLDHTELIKYTGCISLIIDIIEEEAYVYNGYSLTNNTMTSSLDKTSDNKVIIVAKNVNNLKIVNKDGYELYADGEKMYFNDGDGKMQRAGTVWGLGNNSYQYVLFTDEYRLSNIDCIDSSTNMRIDYNSYGLTENAVFISDIGSDTVISISPMNHIANVSIEH